MNLPFFSVSKGLELSTLEMMSQVIPRALGNQRQPIAVISGPSFSIELMDELPTGGPHIWSDCAFFYNVTLFCFLSNF